MALIESRGDRRGLKAVCGLLLVIAVVVWLRTWHFPPPQMGTDEESFKTVDALFTAFTTRDRERLDDCERRLVARREAGKLPAQASARLQSLIGQARSGDWDSAAKRLYEFMYGQRRR